MLTFIRYSVNTLTKTMEHCIFFLLIGSIFAFFLFPQISLANPAITINEIMYDAPGTDDKHEWVEIFNSGSEPVDLAGWKINDGDNATNHAFNPPPKNSSRGSFILEPGQFAILAGDAATIASDLSQYAGTIIDTVLSLNNTSATIKILNSENLEIDSTAYNKSSGANGNGKTLEKKSAGWQESAAEGGTPGQTNSSWISQTEPTPSPTSSSTPTPLSLPSSLNSPAPASEEESSPVPSYDYSQDVYLNEFYPYPGAEEKEWVELFNQGSQTVDLAGWQIDDAENSNSPQSISDGAKIEPGDFLVITFEKSIFNNDTDQIRLIWPDGQIIHSISYPKAVKNSSCSRFGAQWLWTNQMTPGAANKKSAATKNETVLTLTPVPSPAPKAQTLIQEAASPQKDSQVKKPDMQESPVYPSQTAQVSPVVSPNYYAAQSQIFDPRPKNYNDKLLVFGLAILALTTGTGFVWFKNSSKSD